MERATRDVVFSSASTEWSTPQALFDQLDSEFHFEVDVCATSENAKCRHYYTKELDGLSSTWSGICWCNPPYGRDIGQWVKKGRDTAKAGKGTVVMLLPARTDTRWFHNYVLGQAEIRFLQGRLKFGDAKHGAPFPSMLAIFKKEDT